MSCETPCVEYSPASPAYSLCSNDSLGFDDDEPPKSLNSHMENDLNAISSPASPPYMSVDDYISMVENMNQWEWEANNNKRKSESILDTPRKKKPVNIPLEVKRNLNFDQLSRDHELRVTKMDDKIPCRIVLQHGPKKFVYECIEIHHDEDVIEMLR